MNKYLRNFLLSPSIKHLILFLILSTTIISGWKLLSLDERTYFALSTAHTFLMKAELKTTVVLLNLILEKNVIVKDNLITFSNNEGIILMEGCSGVKQIVQFILIMIVIPGPWKYKPVFIPIAAFILFLAAIFHFILLAFIIYKYPSFFTFFHNDASRWIFFGIFFLLWVVWEEKFVAPKKNGSSK